MAIALGLDFVLASGNIDSDIVVEVVLRAKRKSGR